MRFLSLVFALALSAVAQGADDKRIDQAKVASEKVRPVMDYDKFQGTERWAVVPKPIAGTGFLNTLTVNPVYFRKEGGLAGYYLVIKYNGFGWLHVSGKTIFLLDDGSKIELVDESRKVETDIGGCSASSCLVTEIFRVVIPKTELERIAKASVVEVAVYGRNTYMTGHFKPHQQAAVRAVLELGQSKGGETLNGSPAGQ